jgi:Fe-S cluster assembly protein SufD
MYAFANNVLESVKNAALSKRVKDMIAEKLGVKIGFDL